MASTHGCLRKKFESTESCLASSLKRATPSDKSSLLKIRICEISSLKSPLLNHECSIRMETQT